MRQESGGRLYGRNGDLVTSGAGAMGLMQVMARPPTTRSAAATPSWVTTRTTRTTTSWPAPPYIREMFDIYGSPGFLAAYNAGPGRLDDYLTRNRTLPEETRRYVASIGPKIASSSPSRGSPGEQYAMTAVPFSIPDGPRYAAASRYSAPAAPIVLNPPRPVQYAALPTPVSEPARAVSSSSTRPARHPSRSPPCPPRRRSSRIASPRVWSRIAARPRPSRRSPSRPGFPDIRAPAYRPSQTQLASAALTPLGPRQGAGGGGFSLFTPANAAPIPRGAPAHSGGGNWAVQVGAFANPSLAASATTAAPRPRRRGAGRRPPDRHPRAPGPGHALPRPSRRPLARRRRPGLRTPVPRPHQLHGREPRRTIVSASPSPSPPGRGRSEG